MVKSPFGPVSVYDQHSWFRIRRYKMTPGKWVFVGLLVFAVSLSSLRNPQLFPSFLLFSYCATMRWISAERETVLDCDLYCKEVPSPKEKMKLGGEPKPSLENEARLNLTVAKRLRLWITSLSVTFFFFFCMRCTLLHGTFFNRAEFLYTPKRFGLHPNLHAGVTHNSMSQEPRTAVGREVLLALAPCCTFFTSSVACGVGQG